MAHHLTFDPTYIYYCISSNSCEKPIPFFSVGQRENQPLLLAMEAKKPKKVPVLSHKVRVLDIKQQNTKLRELSSAVGTNSPHRPH